MLHANMIMMGTGLDNYGWGIADRVGKELLLGHIKFDMPIRFPSEDVK